MRSVKLLFIVTFLLAAVSPSLAQQIWSIGPMFHFNFGGEKRSTSFSLEAAYWNIDDFPYSVDFGVEFDRKRIRLYSEAQTGIGFTGLACGPLLEFNTKDGKVKLGVQGSVWANYFIGADYRIRFVDDTTFHCIGIYGKIPFRTDAAKGSTNNSNNWDGWD
jgi:hypothetical protein